MLLRDEHMLSHIQSDYCSGLVQPSCYLNSVSTVTLAHASLHFFFFSFDSGQIPCNLCIDCVHIRIDFFCPIIISKQG